jgi:hypothetical protein
MMCEFEMFLMMWTGKVVVRWWCRTDIYYLDDCLCTEASKSDLNVATKDIAFRERLSAGCHTSCERLARLRRASPSSSQYTCRIQPGIRW